MSFKIDSKTGLLENARFIPSPNCDDRPAGIEIDMIVIHNISLPPGEFDSESVIQFFTNQLDYQSHPYFLTIKDLKVSSHIFIRRSGEIIQFVPFQKRAWHAGQSYFDGHEACNDFSIGIELEGTDELDYTPKQYQQLIGLTKALMTTYPNIVLSRIVGHNDIAPGRKTDPGAAFDWQLFRKQVST